MGIVSDSFVDRHMKQGERYVPARLQAALALLEKLRDDPSLRLESHLASRGSSGLRSHETYGNRAHERLGIPPINKNHGRRSSSLQDWGQELLETLRRSGFEKGDSATRDRLLDGAQAPFAQALREILEQVPLVARFSGRSAEAIIRDVLRQAEEKGKSGDVAQYLVGAKLTLRLGRLLPIDPANKGDRKSRTDRDARQGDFEIGNTVIEVAMGLPDEKHMAQTADALENAQIEVRLLTRADRVATWFGEFANSGEIDMRRVVVASVDGFVGQNIMELGKFSAKGKAHQLRCLFDIYNKDWVATVGTPGIRVDVR